MKLTLKLAVLLLIIPFSFWSCKKESNIDNGCSKYSSDILKITTTGADTAGRSLALTIDTAGKEAGLEYYWQSPDGTSTKGTTLNIPLLKKTHRGTYHAYYTAPDGCESVKTPFEVQATGVSMADVPCSPKENSLNQTNDGAYSNLVLDPATIKQENGGITINCEPYTYSFFLDIFLNTPTLVPGEYELEYYDKTGFSNLTNKKAKVRFKRGGNNTEWGSFGGGTLYITNKVNGKYEAVICSGEMTTNTGKKGALTLRMDVK